MAFLTGLVGLVGGFCPPSYVFALWGGLLLLALIYEKVIYKPIETTAPDGRWVKTPERFVDDLTGKPVTVYVDPVTGERKYVQE
jgi:hypothetical protein